jgi:hypothetical protein
VYCFTVSPGIRLEKLSSVNLSKAAGNSAGIVFVYSLSQIISRM